MNRRQRWRVLRSAGEFAGLALNPTRLRLLHVLPTYFPATRYGGPIHSVHGLCRALVRLGHEVTVFSTSVDGAGRLDVAENCPVDVDGVRVFYFRSHFDRLYWAPAMRRELAQAIGNTDLVHLHSVFLSPTSVVAAAARRAHVPYVLSPRGMLVPELISARSGWIKRAWIAAFERRNLRGAACIHVTSDTEAADLQRCGLALAPVAMVPNGVDMPDRRDRRAKLGSVLYLGRLSWKKNLDALIDAVSRMPGVTLTLAGPDDEKISAKLLAQAQAAGCGDRVRWVGAVLGREKEELFATHACLVLPSINENFGNSVLEALAWGCPVVVTPGVGARSVVEQSGAGLVAVDATPAAIAAAIGELLHDPDAAEHRGELGRRYARDHVSWDAVALRMTRLYESLNMNAAVDA